MTSNVPRGHDLVRLTAPQLDPVNIVAFVIRLCGDTVLMVKIAKAVRINERHIEELEKLAKKEGETVSFLIQQAIREYLERKATK